MPYIIGVVLAVGVAAVFGRFAGFDRDRAFYSTVLVIVGSFYVLFAAMSQSIHTVLLESVGMTVFSIVAIVGFKSSMWVIAAGLAGHGVFDAFHGYVIDNSAMPVWWPAFCAAYDIAAAACLAWLLQRPRAVTSFKGTQPGA